MLFDVDFGLYAGMFYVVITVVIRSQHAKYTIVKQVPGTELFIDNGSSSKVRLFFLHAPFPHICPVIIILLACLTPSYFCIEMGVSNLFCQFGQIKPRHRARCHNIG